MRGVYLRLLTQDLLDKTITVQEGWLPTGGDYGSTFVGNTGNSDGSSLSLLVNDLNFDFETLKNFKFKIPLGKLNGGQVLPEQLEGYYSGLSLELAIAQTEALRDLYLGVDENGANGEGLDDYLRCLETSADISGDPLADAIELQFNDILTALNALNSPLSDELVNNKAAMDAAYQEMQEMIPLLKREMVAAFGVRISYVDNDGD